MKISYLGTTMLLFDDGTNQILFDCHVTRPSLLTCLGGRLKPDTKVVDKVIRDFDMGRLGGIFISHSHHDHVMDAPVFARKCGCNVYGSASTCNIARGNGVPENRIFSYEDAMAYRVGEFQISVIPSLHSRPHWYNNDIGMMVEEPFSMPAPKKAFKEGGSVDFLVTHRGRRYLIRPSYNYVDHQLDNIRADVLFLGISGLSKDSRKGRERFFAATIGTVQPELVIPVHWDNFFTPLYGPVKGMPVIAENTGKSIALLATYCRDHHTNCIVQPPLTTMEL